jgi:hypothetical protein
MKENTSQFEVHVPVGIRSKEELLSILKEILLFPDYFGQNWDALSDSLRDLHWIRQGKVILIHREMPVLSAEDLLEYLEILNDATDHWKDGKDHELIVKFPSAMY